MILTTLNIKLNLIIKKRNQVQKRFMFSRRGLGHFPLPVKPPNSIAQNPTAHLRDHLMQKRYATYHVDRTNINESSHNQAQANPLLGKLKKTFQHPFIGRDLCENADCSAKVCTTPCVPIKEQTYVGHGTHGNVQGAVEIGTTDFKGQTKQGPQKAVFYDSPIKNHDNTGQNIDLQMTVNLNNDKQMIHNVHNNSSRKKPLQEYGGSDDLQNIN